MIRIAHIINPVAAPPGSELHRVQPVTIESIRQALAFTDRSIDAKPYTVGYAEDHAVMPDFATILPDLDRSVLDLGTFTKKKKLPLIAEILHRLYDYTDADWLIYTNADICLMPQFYNAVAAMIEKGHDALLINRRRISAAYDSPAALPMMYSDLGAPHPGYDCFVFHRSLLPLFVLDQICIGVPFIEVTLLHNFIAFAKSLKHADDLHLTFHIGMEAMPPIDQEYYRYNRNIYDNKVLPALRPHLDINKFPYASQPFYKRLTKWMINPCYSTALVLELEGKSLPRRIKVLIDEVRWRILSK